MHQKSYRTFVERLLADPSEIWRHAYEQEISNGARTVLLTVFSCGGQCNMSDLRSIFTALHTARSARYNFQARPEDFKTSLREVVGPFLKAKTAHLVEVIDPSVLDLLNTIVSEAPDNAIDIISTAQTFNQIQHVWSFVRSKGLGVVAAIRSQADEIAPAVRECMLATRRMPMEGGTAFYGLQLERRLQTIVEMACAIEASSFLNLVTPMANFMFAEWQAGDHDIDSGIDLLDTLESEASLAIPNRDELCATIRAGLLEISREGVFSNELQRLLSVFDLESERDFEARSILRDSFSQYPRTCFSEDLRNCRSLDEFDVLRDELDDFHAALGVDVNALLSRVADARAEFDERQAQYESHQEDEWKERYYEQRYEDESVTGMFGTLRDDRS